jgi:hypothetical protein
MPKILIQEFFFLGTVNGLYSQFKLYTSVSPHRMVIARIKEMIWRAITMRWGDTDV